MSIIYEALKKVDESIAPIAVTLPASQKKTKKTMNLLSLLLYLGAATGGCLIASIIFNFLTARGLIDIPQGKKTCLSTKKDTIRLHRNQDSFNKPKEPSLLSFQENILSPLLNKIAEEIKQKQAPEGLILNGLFFSENQDSFVLINNRILKEGDVINGAALKRISLNEVELERNGSIIRLSNNE